jgi:hypothetical protein
MKRYYSILAALAVVIAASAVSFSQSTNRDNPTPISSSEVSGNFTDPDRGAKEYFYSFTAGPGDLTLTVDLKGRDRDSSGSMAYELLKGNASEEGPILCCEYAQMGGGTTGRSVASVKLTRRQTVVLHLTNSMYRGGSFNIRFSGTASSGGMNSGNGGFGNGSGAGPGHDNAGNGNGGFGNGSGGGPDRDRSAGDPVDVPQTGILHIRMKNGTVQDIDLSRVRSITVRQ